MFFILIKPNARSVQRRIRRHGSYKRVTLTVAPDHPHLNSFFADCVIKHPWLYRRFLKSRPVRSLVNDNLRTPLMETGYGNCTPVCLLLLCMGADIDHQNQHRETALHIGILYTNNSKDTCKYLIGFGCNVDILTRKKSSPLTYALVLPDHYASKKLIEAGAHFGDMEAKYSGMTFEQFKTFIAEKTIN